MSRISQQDRLRNQTVKAAVYADVYPTEAEQRQSLLQGAYAILVAALLLLTVFSGS